jgi:hypothetical protein
MAGIASEILIEMQRQEFYRILPARRAGVAATP